MGSGMGVSVGCGVGEGVSVAVDVGMAACVSAIMVKAAACAVLMILLGSVVGAGVAPAPQALASRVITMPSKNTFLFIEMLLSKMFL